MQKSSLMAWVGGTVRSNQVLIPSIRCGKAPLSFPLAGAVLPDGDYVVSGVLQLDGPDPVLLPLAYAAHSGGAFLRLAGEVVGGKVLQRECGLPDGAFHSQVIAWGERLLLADSRFEGSVAKAVVEPVQIAASQEEKPVESVAAEKPAEPVAQKEAGQQEEVPRAAVAVQGELAWEPSSLPAFSGDELDRVSLTVPIGQTAKWPVTEDPCPPLTGDPGKVIVQAAPVVPEKSVTTLRKARRRADDKSQPEPSSEPPALVPEAENTPKVRNMDDLTF